MQCTVWKKRAALCIFCWRCRPLQALLSLTLFTLINLTIKT